MKVTAKLSQLEGTAKTCQNSDGHELPKIN